jgi:hypothetical protein
MKYYLNERWRPILAHNGLTDFAALWQHKAEWFEEPNHRRGGWSGVARCELTLPNGGVCAIFLKRQENHSARLWTHPVRGVPTFYREFRQIMHYRDCGIPTLDPVYFSMHREGKDHRAILITEELTGFVSMEDRVQDWLKNGAPPRKTRLRYLETIADLMRNMHAKGIQHNCFFPKHVFTRVTADGNIEARIIDLEKSRWRPSRTASALRDLYTLNHDSLCWSCSDRLWFFKTYLQIDHLTPFAKWLWHRIEKHSIKKKRYQPPAIRLSVMLRQQSTLA